MRRTTTFTVNDPASRDHGKKFLITEMPADQGERWATQVAYLLAQARGGQQVEAEDVGMAGLAAAGAVFSSVAQIRALQDPSVNADTWSCIRYVHSDKNPPQPIFEGENSQIEEISTRSLLRVEVLKLHTGFFTAGNPSNSAQPESTG